MVYKAKFIVAEMMNSVKCCKEQNTVSSKPDWEQPEFCSFLQTTSSLFSGKMVFQKKKSL